ncbi:uncharacterized protein LOC118409629 [Branchiostoma floridae]|uniref:Uncharacterized protein LOC118409629 n=1 Tax=Branchiostoma floridae TaxID=7739 RepID=A0A9J7MG19_BRAFL|nr:uncharacterized protein LOC118409629 [Branchiostoma floridae]
MSNIPAEERQGYLKDMEGKSKAELVDLLRRQELLLNNRRFLNTLPDKGARIIDMVKRLHQLIHQKGEIEAAMEKLQKMQISSGNITTIQEDDEEQCEIDTKEEMLPHNDIEDFTEQQSDDKKTVVVKSYDNISVSANQGGKVLTKEQQRTRTFMAKYSDGKVEMPRLNVAMKQDTSATLVAKETGLKPTPPQKHKLQVAVEETAATPPQYKHGAVHELPLDQAIELWQEQHRKQEELRAQHAVHQPK